MRPLAPRIADKSKAEVKRGQFLETWFRLKPCQIRQGVERRVGVGRGGGDGSSNQSGDADESRRQYVQQERRRNSSTVSVIRRFLFL